MAFFHIFAIIAFCEARTFQGVMRTPVFRMGPCMSHSYYHIGKYTDFRLKSKLLCFFGYYDTLLRAEIVVATNHNPTFW